MSTTYSTAAGEQAAAAPAPDHDRRQLAGSRRVRTRLSPFMACCTLVALLLAALVAYPVFKTLARVFYVDGNLDFSIFGDTLREPGLGRIIVNTFVVVLVSTVLAVIIGSVLAWLSERTNARMGFVSDALPLLPFLLPPIAGAIGWVLLLSDRAGLINVLLRRLLANVGMDMTEGPLNIYSYYGLIFVYTLYSVPFVYMMVSSGLRNLDPSLEEQSKVCGATTWRTLWRVTLPGVKPSMASGILLSVWVGTAMYSVPSVIGTGADIDVLSMRIVDLTQRFPSETGTAVGVGMIIVAAVGLTYYVQMRVIRSGHHATIGGKGQRQQRVVLGRWRWPARFFILAYVLVAVVLPVIGLMSVALNGFWSIDIKWSELSLKAFRYILIEDAITRRAVTNSVKLSVIGATVGMLLAAMIAYAQHRRPTKKLRVLDGFIKLPAVLSGIVVAVGFLIAFSGPPFNLQGTVIILLLGYLVVSMPQGGIAASTAAAQVGHELSEASAVAGAKEGRTFVRVALPLMLPGLTAGWALMFARMVEDLTISAVLAGTSNPVVGPRILDIFETGSFARLAALSLVLTVVSSVVVCAVLYGGRLLGVESRVARRRRRKRPPIEAPPVLIAGADAALVTTHHDEVQA